MKKLIAGLLTGAMILSMGTTAFAKGNIYVDLVEAKGASPQIVNDRTMVPVRAITEMLGYKVNWIESLKQVEVCDPYTGVVVITMNINSTRAYYVNEYGARVQKTLDSPATLINDRTYVPLRFISEAVGYTVDYNVDTADVYLFSPEYQASHVGEGKGEDRPSGIWDDGIGEDRPSGVWDDGIGEDRPSGIWDDGIGAAVPLTFEEQVYVLDQMTYDWLAMTPAEKDDYVMMVGRWWEDYENIIVEDYDEMIDVLDHQCEQYYRNDVNEFVFFTLCDIYGVDVDTYATMG